MPDVYYPGIAAGDSASIGPDGTVSAVVTPNAFYQVFELSDTAFSTPLTIKTPAGLTDTKVPVGALPLFPDVYVVSPNFAHNWKSGGLVFRRDSADAKDLAVAGALAAAQQVAAGVPERVTAEVQTVAATGAFKGEAGRDGSNVVPTDAAIKQAIEDPASETSTALSATIVGVSRPELINAAGADPFNHGASGTADSATAFTAAATVSKVINLRPGGFYRLTTAVTLPAGTTVEGNGATLQLLTKGGLIATDDCTIRGVKFSNGNTSGFVGGERAITVQGKNVLIERNSFAGQDYRHGIVVERSGGGSCDHCTIRFNTFTNTAYGILKQGGPTSTPTTAHYMKVHDNKFSIVRRGDAIELNAGSDHDILIESNIIDDVTAATTNFAGFGIAVAGLTGYSASEENRFRRCTIANNIITNVEKEGIHAEVSARIEIKNNHVEQVAANRLGTGVGITVYGSINCDVSGNSVYQFSTGILDGIGFLNGENIISTDRNKVRDNTVANCTVGISEGVAGEGKTAFITRNTLTGCATGIKQFGAASGVYYTGNTLVACPTPFNIDANPAAKTAIAATNKRVFLKDNQAHALDGTTPTNVYANTTGTTFSGDGNTFVLPA